MTLQERRFWSVAVTSVLAYEGYLWCVATHTGGGGGSLAKTAYQKLLLASIGAAIVASIGTEIVLAIIKQVDTRRDVRDQEIAGIGDGTGSSR